MKHRAPGGSSSVVVNNDVWALVGARGARAVARTNEILQAMAHALQRSRKSITGNPGSSADATGDD